MLPSPFETLDQRALTRFSFPKGGHVFCQGDVTQGMFFVVSGSVDLIRVTEAGVLVTMHVAAKGDSFAEASLYSDTYHCNAICMSETEVIRLGKEQILKRQTQDAAFSVELTRRLAAQVQSYRQLAMLQAVKHAEDRVMQAVSLGLLTVSVTHLASQIGLTRETCYRALRTLVRQGQLIQTGRGQYRPAPVR